MNKINTKQLAIKETIILWEYLADEGLGKREAIRILIKNGKLSKNSYYADCPLCQEFKQQDGNCFNCPWPKSKITKDSPACLGLDSPYYEWINAFTLKDKKIVAQKIVNLIKELL